MSCIRNRAGALAGAVVILATAACSDLAATNEARTDTQNFPLSGKALTIVQRNSHVRIVEGGSGEVEAKRTVSGKAAQDGNATWSMAGDTLSVETICSGITINCDGRYELKVPAGTEVTVQGNGGSYAIVGMTGAVNGTLDGTALTVDGTTGPLKVKSTQTGDITVANAKSPDVVVAAVNAKITLGFAAAPQQVTASNTTGDITITVPGSGYRVSASSQTAKANTTVATDPAGGRAITAQSAHGNVTVAGA